MTKHIFFAAPHRVMFTGGIAQLLLIFALWGGELLLRAGGQGATLLPWLPSTLWHPLLMVFGFFPFLIFGFLMTALPKWVGAPPLDRSGYLPAFAAMLGGWLLFDLAAVAGVPLLAGGGLLLAAVGWGLGVRALARAAGVDNPDKRHAWSAIVAVACGAALLAVAGLALMLRQPALLRAATLLGLWGFLVPLFVVVVHRMLPFFSQGTIPGTPYRPMWMLWVLLAALAGHGLIVAFGLPAGSLWIVDAPAAGVALALTRRWQLRRSFANRLLATHHVAFAWLGVALALSALQSLLALRGVTWGGNAPLHALSTGFLLLMVLGMATRVTHGHSGLPIGAAPWLWVSFWVLQAAVLLRLAAEFVGPATAAWLLPASALAMLGVFAYWASRYLGNFFRPRADGEPG